MFPAPERPLPLTRRWLVCEHQSEMKTRNRNTPDSKLLLALAAGMKLHPLCYEACVNKLNLPVMFAIEIGRITEVESP